VWEGMSFDLLYDSYFETLIVEEALVEAGGAAFLAPILLSTSYVNVMKMAYL
jgi:hypothetical protein